MLIASSETKIVPKKCSIIKNNEQLFYLGKDKKELKYFFDKPKLSCGWYYSINNITTYTKNMRGMVFTASLGSESESLTRNYYLVESTCNLQELLNKIKETIPFLDEFKRENNPKRLYELLYDIIPNKFVEIEKLVCDTSNKKTWELKGDYVDQTLKEIKDTIQEKEKLIRYMIFNSVKHFNMQSVESHIQELNNYRNRFILFKLFD